MATLERKFEALAAFVLAEDEQAKDSARKALKACMYPAKTQASVFGSGVENVIHDFLMEIGVPPHLRGYRYAVYGIEDAVNNPDVLDSVTRVFYPHIAIAFDTTACGVERAIGKLIEETWSRGNPDVLDKYFSNLVKADTGKPTNSEFIARCMYIVRQKMRH